MKAFPSILHFTDGALSKIHIHLKSIRVQLEGFFFFLQPLNRAALSTVNYMHMQRGDFCL